MLAKGHFKDGEKEQWQGIMTMEIMSSEESGQEEGGDVLIVHPLPWLSESVSKVKSSLDQQVKPRSPEDKRRKGWWAVHQTEVWWTIFLLGQ